MKILDNIPVEGKLQQSDLFFNHEHPNLEALFRAKRRYPSFDDQHAAILKDATEFANNFGGDAQWYADDFMRRL